MNSTTLPGRTICNCQLTKFTTYKKALPDIVVQKLLVLEAKKALNHIPLFCIITKFKKRDPLKEICES